MTDESAFLAAILADADNDTPRLVYADWLEERGDPRGEFIRVQCEFEAASQNDSWPEGPAGMNRYNALRERESRLLTFHAAEWAAPLRPLMGAGFRPRFRRGFVDWLELPLREFLAKGDEINRLTPLAGVTLKILPADHTISVPGEGPDWLQLIRDLVRSPWMGRLRDLNLAGNQLDDRAVRILAPSPNVTGLRTLDLCGNDLTIAGVRALAKSKRLTNLRKLGLSDNPRIPARTYSAVPWGGALGDLFYEFGKDVTGLFPPRVQIW
jgi:uncharacterized protein (TIGR02996 family)